MRRWLAEIFLLLLFSSIKANAMDPPVPKNMPPEIFLLIGNSDPEIFMMLERVCSAWREIISNDDFWKAVYFKKRGTDVKLDNTKSFKENCRICPFYCHILEQYEMVSRQGVIIHEMHPSDQDQLFEGVLTQKPGVFCCTEYLYFEHAINSLQPAERLFPFLEKAVSEDVIVVFSVPNSGANLNRMLGDKNLHEAYPNVIWLALANKNQEFVAGGEVDLADIAIPCNHTSFEFCIFVADLRSVRPGLSAPTIRLLIRDTARKGLIDYEAAKKATIEYKR